MIKGLSLQHIEDLLCVQNQFDIAGDLNACSLVYGNNSYNNFGIILEEALPDSNECYYQFW